MRRQLQWLAWRYSETLGWPGVLALMLAGAGLLFSLLWWLPASAELQRLQQQPLPSHLVQRDPLMNPQQTLQTYIIQFPPLSERSRQIEHLVAIAEAQSIFLEEVSYRMDARQPGLSHYRVDFTTAASYAELQAFLSKVLSSMPLMSLESLTLRRDDRDSEQIEARMQFVLHFAN